MNDRELVMHKCGTMSSYVYKQVFLMLIDLENMVGYLPMKNSH